MNYTSGWKRRPAGIYCGRTEHANGKLGRRRERDRAVRRGTAFGRSPATPRWLSGGHIILVAPDLINAEVGNIVWKKQTFQGLGADDAKAVIEGSGKLDIAFTPTAQLLRSSDFRPGFSPSYDKSVGAECRVLAPGSQGWSTIN
jgi:hypothetical protein